MKNILNYTNFCFENKIEYIDFNSINLQKEFDYLNDLMFDNKILPITIKWFKSKTKIGLLTHTKTVVDKLEISNFYKMTMKQFQETLAHEMIHAYMVQNNIFEKNDHGTKFFNILNDLNSRFPQFNIKKSEDASEFSVNSIKSKSIGALLFNTDNEYSVIFVSLDIINSSESIDKFIEDLKSYIKRVPLNIFYKDKSVEIELYKCSNPDLLSFKIKRTLTLSNLSFFSVNDKTLSNIKEGDFIKTIKLK